MIVEGAPAISVREPGVTAHASGRVLASKELLWDGVLAEAVEAPCVRVWLESHSPKGSEVEVDNSAEAVAEVWVSDLDLPQASWRLSSALAPCEQQDSAGQYLWSPDQVGHLVWAQNVFDRSSG